MKKRGESFAVGEINMSKQMNAVRGFIGSFVY